MWSLSSRYILQSPAPYTPRPCFNLQPFYHTAKSTSNRQQKFGFAIFHNNNKNEHLYHFEPTRATNTSPNTRIMLVDPQLAYQLCMLDVEIRLHYQPLSADDRNVVNVLPQLITLSKGIASLAGTSEGGPIPTQQQLLHQEVYGWMVVGVDANVFPKGGP
jgi:hypothetical protein